MGGIRARFPLLGLVWVDGGYVNSVDAGLVGWARDSEGIEIVAGPRNADVKGFQVLPRRWVVERTLCAARRLVVSPAQPGGTRREVSGSADRTIGALSTALGVAAPAELEPIVVALMLGITTDYSIFFLAGLQRRLRDGHRNPHATRAAVQEYLPIVATAGFTVACGVAALVVARSGLFRQLGPGLAVTVLVGLGSRSPRCPHCWPSWAAGRSGPAASPPPGPDSTTAAPLDAPAGRDLGAIGPSARPSPSGVIGLLRDRRVAAGVVR